MTRPAAAQRAAHDSALPLLRRGAGDAPELHREDQTSLTPTPYRLAKASFVEVSSA